MGVGRSRHSTNGMQFQWIDFIAAKQDIFGNMNHQDLANYDTSPSGLIANFDDLGNLAFEVNRTFGHAWRTDAVGGDRGESRDVKLVGLSRKLRCGCIHRLGQIFRHDIDHKFPSGAHIVQRILLT